jgi:hypothetical protein
MAYCIFLLYFSHRVSGGGYSQDNRSQGQARIRGSVRIYFIMLIRDNPLLVTHVRLSLCNNRLRRFPRSRRRTIRRDPLLASPRLYINRDIDGIKTGCSIILHSTLYHLQRRRK